MDNKQKIDIILIEDKLNLSCEELLARAQVIAAEDALIYGWESVEVMLSASPPEKNSEFMRYSFDVFGVPKKNIHVSPEQQSPAESSPTQKSAASPSVEI